MGILTPDMKRVIDEQRLGFVASVDADGTPNLSPKGTTAAWDDDHLVFADIRSPRTLDNLRARPAVEVNVVDPILRKGWRFKGTARVVGPGDELEAIRRFYASARGMAIPFAHAVLVRVERALPVVSPGYDDGTSEQAMAAQYLAKLRERWNLR